MKQISVLVFVGSLLTQWVGAVDIEVTERIVPALATSEKVALENVDLLARSGRIALSRRWAAS